MEVTKPYKFIGFGATEVTKPYKFIGFGAMEVTKPYEFIGFGAIFRSDNAPARRSHKATCVTGTRQAQDPPPTRPPTTTTPTNQPQLRTEQKPDQASERRASHESQPRAAAGRSTGVEAKDVALIIRLTKPRRLSEAGLAFQHK